MLASSRNAAFGAGNCDGCWRREGRHLLRTNLSGHDPAELWQFYVQLVEVEAAFKNLKACTSPCGRGCGRCSINLADLGYRTVVRYVARDSTNLAGLGYGTVVRYVAGSNKVTTRNRADMLFVMLPEAAQTSPAWVIEPLFVMLPELPKSRVFVIVPVLLFVIPPEEA
jgi:hypothetical protein